MQKDRAITGPHRRHKIREIIPSKVELLFLDVLNFTLCCQGPFNPLQSI